MECSALWKEPSANIETKARWKPRTGMIKMTVHLNYNNKTVKQSR